MSSHDALERGLATCRALLASYGTGGYPLTSAQIVPSEAEAFIHLAKDRDEWHGRWNKAAAAFDAEQTARLAAIEETRRLRALLRESYSDKDIERLTCG